MNRAASSAVISANSDRSYKRQDSNVLPLFRCYIVTTSWYYRLMTLNRVEWFIVSLVIFLTVIMLFFLESFDRDIPSNSIRPLAATTTTPRRELPTDLVSEHSVPSSATSSLIRITNFAFLLPAHWKAHFAEFRSGDQLLVFTYNDESFRIQCSPIGQAIGGKGMESASILKKQSRVIQKGDSQYTLMLNTMTAPLNDPWLQFHVSAGKDRPRCNGQGSTSVEVARAMQEVYESWQAQE